MHPAVTERIISLMGIIKSECVHAKTYDDREQAALEIFEYMECFYNRLRIHSVLGYMSPCEYEERCAIQPLAELKWDRPADAALDQVRRRNYPAALAGLAGECVLVGITYREGTDEHECRIERVSLG